MRIGCSQYGGAHRPLPLPRPATPPTEVAAGHDHVSPNLQLITLFPHNQNALPCLPPLPNGNPQLPSPLRPPLPTAGHVGAVITWAPQAVTSTPTRPKPCEPTPFFRTLLASSPGCTGRLQRLTKWHGHRPWQPSGGKTLEQCAAGGPGWFAVPWAMCAAWLSEHANPCRMPHAACRMPYARWNLGGRGSLWHAGCVATTPHPCPLEPRPAGPAVPRVPESMHGGLRRPVGDGRAPRPPPRPTAGPACWAGADRRPRRGRARP